MSPSNDIPQVFSLRKLLFKNTGIQLAAQFLSFGVGFAAIFILSRYFDVAHFGGLNYVFAFYYCFQMLAEFGMDIVVVRECSQRPGEADRIIGTVRTFKFFWSLFLVMAAWLVIGAVDFPPSLEPGLYIYAFLLPLLSLELPSAIFSVKLKAEYPALFTLSRSIVNGVCLIGLIFLGLGISSYIFALLISECVVVGLVLFYARRYVKPQWGIDLAILRKVLRSSFPIALTGIFVTINNRFDFIFLERLTDLQQVGLYAAIHKITALLESLPIILMATIYPLMSKYAHADLEKLKRLYLRSFQLLALTAIPMGLSITLFAELIVKIVFGAPFMAAVPGLQIMVWTTVCLYLALSGANVMISLGKEKINLYINMAASIINVSLNLLWIPRSGFVGAAAATTCAYAFIAACTLIATHVCLKRARKTEGAGTL